MATGRGGGSGPPPPGGGGGGSAPGRGRRAPGGGWSCRPRSGRRWRGRAVTTILAFVVVIGLLILIHELGHFIVARLCGVGVERFSLGFGPVLWRFKGKEAEYWLSAIPMGGYVKMMGDDENPLEGGKTGMMDPARAFNLKPVWARFLIVFAGPAMNFVLAFL